MSGEIHSAIQDIPQLPSDSNSELKDDVKNTTKSGLCCDICNVKVTSTKILQRHLEGKKHRMKVERKDKSFICDLCEVVANSEIQLNIHLNSSKHKNRLVRKEYAEFTAISTNSKGLWIIMFCVVCIFINLLLLFKVVL